MPKGSCGIYVCTRTVYQHVNLPGRARKFSWIPIKTTAERSFCNANQLLNMTKTQCTLIIDVAGTTQTEVRSGKFDSQFMRHDVVSVLERLMNPGLRILHIIVRDGCLGVLRRDSFFLGGGAVQSLVLSTSYDLFQIMFGRRWDILPVTVKPGPRKNKWPDELDFVVHVHCMFVRCWTLVWTSEAVLMTRKCLKLLTNTLRVSLGVSKKGFRVISVKNRGDTP